MKLILASASPRRRELLHQIGLRPMIRPSNIEETITSTKPNEVVMELSCQKAEDVYRQMEKEEREPFLVIGADTVVANEGTILGKPKTHDEAFHMIDSLQGKMHQVYTGVTLIKRDAEGMCHKVTFAEETEVFVYPMTPEEIRTYADSNEPMDKAGGYGIQGTFAAYIQKIHGDYTNVVGLPIGRVFQEMKTL